MGKATTTTSSRRSTRLAQRSSSSARNSDEDDSAVKSPAPPGPSTRPLPVVVSSDDDAAGPSADKGTNEDSGDKDIDCSVCLLDAVQPVKLPCGHIFCFLCIKGVMQSTMTGTCALCRAPVPRNFLFNPELVEPPASSQSEEEEEWRWFYEGRGGGWWQYDERTSTDIEQAFLKRQQRQQQDDANDDDDDEDDDDDDDEDELELLIAGFIYVIDLEAMVQKRKCAPQIQRRIKRDRNIPDKKGVAGISRKKKNKRTNRQNQRQADGTPV